MKRRAFHDRAALAVVLGLGAVAVVPLLGRRVTSPLHLDPLPRSHATCVAVVYSQTSSSSGALLQAGVTYHYRLPSGMILQHDHDALPAPPSEFERHGTRNAALAAAAFSLLWAGVRWFGRRVASDTPPGRAALLGLSLGNLLAMPPAVLAGWVAARMTEGEPVLPWPSGGGRVGPSVQLTAQALGALAVTAWFLSLSRRRAVVG